MKALAERGARRVESRQNARVKELRAALAHGARTAQGLIGLEGMHLVQEARKAGLDCTVCLCGRGRKGCWRSSLRGMRKC